MPLPEGAPYLQVEEGEGLTVVRFRRCRDLDELAAQGVGDQLLRLADGAAQPTLVLDFATVEYLTSTLLGKLLALHRGQKARGGRLVLANVAVRLYEIFEVTRLHTILDVRRAGPAAEVPGHLSA